MSLFGDREDDPLLQNDPLAPSPDEGPEGESPSNQESPSENAASEIVSSDPEQSSSVFGDGSARETEVEDHFRFDGSEDTRVIVRSMKTAANGQLTVINSALDQGWRIDRVELRPSSPETSDAVETDASPEDSFVLAFVLRSPE